MGIEVEVPLTNVVADNKLEIAIPDNSSIVDTSTSIVAQVIPNSYVLSSAGMYSAGFSGATVPSWLQDAITSELADGTLDMRGLISSLQTLTSSLESGISQQLERIHNAEEAISASETSFVARLGSNQATVLALVNTKATKAEVEASVSNIIAAEFDSNAGAWFTDHISTYATDIATNASSLTTLSSTLNNSATGLLATADTANHFYTNTGYDPVTQSLVANAGYFGSIQASIGDVAAHITSVENVTVGNFVQWNGISAPKQGMFKLVGTSPNQVQYNYLGGLLGENNDGWVRTDASAATLGDAAYALANRTGALFNANEATPPTATGIGDIWVVTDRWYTASTGTAVNSVEYAAVVPATNPVTYYPRYGKATKRWSGTAWVLLSNGSTTLTNITWAAGASKLITAPDGAITGWSFGDGSGLNSEFKISADKFILANETTGHQPFIVDLVSGQSVFQGKVTFTSGGSTAIGTINEAITANIEQVQVGDKNINITDNLIPTTSLLTDINNAGYQFIGDPIKSSEAGIDTFSEPQFTLDANDEVYSPYIEDLVYGYYYRFGIKGITGLSSVKVVTLNALNAVTETAMTYTMVAPNVLAADTWYIVDGIINPTGGDATAYSGSIRNALGEKIGTVKNIAMPTGSTKLVLGWKYNCIVSRPKLAKITADTLTGSYATTDYVNTTTIDGSRITTGKIESANGNTYFDLTNNQIKMNNGSFILDSTAAGTSLAPNIQGGYIKGVTIEGVTIEGVTMNASDIKVFSNYVGKTGNISYSLSSGYLHGPNYGSGHLASRVCQFTSRITIIGSWGYASGFGQLVTATLDYAINGGPWVTLATGYAGAGTGGLPLGATVLLSDLTSLAACTITFRITGNYAYGNHFWVATLNNQ